MQMPDGETFGERVARLREERGFTQAELGDRVGIRQSHLSDLERGRLHFSAELVVRLAKSLDLSTDELLGLKPIKRNEKSPRRLMRRLQQLAELPEAEQKLLLKTIDAVVDRHRLRTSAAR